MTLGLTAVSFILTLIILPSFWADLQQMDSTSQILSLFSDESLRNLLGWAGTIIASALILFSFVVGFQSIWYIGKVWGVIKRSLKRIEKAKKS